MAFCKWLYRINDWHTCAYLVTQITSHGKVYGTEHSLIQGIIVIVDAYMKGIRSFDLDLAYKAMKQAATMPQKHAGRADLSSAYASHIAINKITHAQLFVDWIKKGYVASDVSQRGCSETLEYAYDDWALGNFAKVIGELEDAEIFLNRSKNYKACLYITQNLASFSF